MTLRPEQFEEYLINKYPLYDLRIELVGQALELVSIAFCTGDRKMGYGRAVIQELMDYTRELKLLGIVLHSAPNACGFYTKLGFTRTTGARFIWEVA